MESVIFDLDGTLVETEQLWQDVRREFALKNGGRWSVDSQPAMMGMRTVEWARYMHDVLRVAMAPEEIARRVIADIVERLRRHVPVLPGAGGALERLAQRYRMAVATSAARPVAQAVLDKTGWMRYFGALVTSDDVPLGKPAPDVFLRAAECIGAVPTLTAAVEDSTNGIRSAHAAKMAVIAIPNREFAPDPGAVKLAARVISSLDALDVRLVSEAIASRK